MVRAIAAHTGYSENIIRHILDVQCELLRASLLRQEEVVISTLLRLTPALRTMEIRQEGKGDRVKVRKILLQVRPVKSFRKELNKWTSTA